MPQNVSRSSILSLSRDAAAGLHGDRDGAGKMIGEFLDDVRLGEALFEVAAMIGPGGVWNSLRRRDSAWRRRLPFALRAKSGASGAMASFRVEAKGRTSYSTLIAAAASWARSSVSAATMATGSPCRLISCGKSFGHGADSGRDWDRLVSGHFYK